MRYLNRSQAGKDLAEKLKPFVGERPVVLALPRGGVPVAYEIKQALACELDIFIVKKIGVPWSDELALGALAENSEPFWNEQILSQTDIDEEGLKALVKKKSDEIAEQSLRLRGEKMSVDVTNRVVILVDDGLATGSTMLAAIEAIKLRNPKQIVVATPVGSKQAIKAVQEKVDQVIVGHIPQSFYSVSLWYEDFAQVTDDEVKKLLESRDTECEKIVIIDGELRLAGQWDLPFNARGIVLFAHGSGSAHTSPRNRRVAMELHKVGLGTLLFDLLSEKEGIDRGLVFDIQLLSRRLKLATHWVRERLDLPIGYFGASTGAAAALATASSDPSIFAVVSRGGRPDLALEKLSTVSAPTLLIVGGDDDAVIPLNEKAQQKLTSAQMVIVPGATHLFEEPGTMDKVIQLASSWFVEHLPDQAFTKTNITRFGQDLRP